MDKLKEKTIQGVFWNLLERVGMRVIGFLPSIILARLLSPKEFGLVGMLSLFVALSEVFLDSGFGAALIQKKNATFEDECSIFYFNILVGGLAALTLFFAAPLIADFYNQPILTSMMRWLSVDLLIGAFGFIQNIQLIRRMDFKSLLKVNLLATLAGGVAGVSAAYLGLGVWSLVLQIILNTVFQTVALWWLCDWRPAFIFNLNSLRGMFGFGSHLFFSNLFRVFFDNLYQIFIGKVFSATALGYYTRATSLRIIFIDSTVGVLSKVLFPSMSSIQDDAERLKRVYRKSILLVTFAYFPLMLGLIVVAGPLITVLFSVKWQESILYFQLICVAGLLYPLSVINLEILKVKGRSDLFLRVNLIKQSLLLATIFITYRWGISAMLAGQIVNSVIAYILNSLYSERLIGYSIINQGLDFLPNLMIASIMAVGMWGLGFLLPDENLGRLVAQFVFGFVLYFSINRVAQTDLYFEFIAMSKNMLFRFTGNEG